MAKTPKPVLLPYPGKPAPVPDSSTLRGLQKLCRLYGRMKARDQSGEVEWVWCFYTEQPRLKHEMTPSEIAWSERAKWEKAMGIISENNQ